MAVVISIYFIPTRGGAIALNVPGI